MDVNALKAAADEYEAAYEKRLAADQLAKALKEVETAAKKKLVEMSLEAKVENVVGTHKLYTIKPEDMPIVEDWEKLYAYIIDTEDMSLLERRLSKAAVNEMLEAGEKVPGVGTMVVYKINRGKKL